MTAAAALTGRREDRVLEWRFRLVASCLALVALAFVQQPGKLVADTKLDLAANPEGLLQRALFMWDSQGAFGQLQNQGYGYLFPTGPFFWLGELIDMPAWAVQRAWSAVVLVVAFLGLVKLAEVLGVGSPSTRIIAGFAFALSPRFVTTLGPISVEAWPSAVAPWVLVPLVYGTQRGSPARAAALSALAISCIGGVNAAAAAAVLPLPAIWLLLQRRGPRRNRLMVWWPVFTLMGTLWWLVPLFLLGGYSPPFLDFIETATATTFPTTLFDALRGTSHWVPYVEADWAAGRALLTEPYLIIDTAVVVVLGLIGLTRTDLPHRGFLVAGLMTGLVMVTAGHLGALQGWWAADVHGWLDGALAPLRNLHKFDVILRLPLVLGLAHLLAVVQLRFSSSRESARAQRLLHVGLVLIAVTTILGSASPLLTGKFTRSGEFSSIPSYWGDATRWLAERDEGNYALLVPGSSFGSYVWGYPADEPMQVLARSPWAVRNAIPLAPPGNIRMLDAVESRLNTGEGSPGLAPFLARAGVEYLVVRNDLARSDDVPEPVLVHQALSDSPGISPVAWFGPMIGADARLDDGTGPRVVANHGWQTVYPAIAVFRVAGAERAVASTPPPVVAGGPEELLQLTDLGVLQDEPTVLAVDAQRGDPPRRMILTDGLRLKRTAFGRIHDNASTTLTVEEAAQQRRASREYVLGEDDRWATAARLDGVEDLRASSSLSDLAGAPAEPQHLPFAAVDGDPQTSWVSGYRDGAGGPWLELRFDHPVDPRQVDITLGDAAGREARRVRVVSDRAQAVSSLLEVEQKGTIRLGGGPTRTLRVELAKRSRFFGARLDIAELDIPGVRVTRPLVLPSLPERWGTPDTIVLSAADGYTTGCVQVGDETRCAPGRAREAEDGAVLDRVVTLNGARGYWPRIVAAPRPGPELDELLQRDQLFGVASSSSTTSDPRGGPLAAVDDDPGTTWTADPDDVAPELRLRWIGRRPIRGISLSLNDSAAAVPAVTIEVSSPKGARKVRLDRNGYGSFAPLRTDQLTVRFRNWGRGSNLQYDGSASALPVGVSEVALRGFDAAPLRVDPLLQRWGCGSGPSLRVNGTVHRSTLIASRLQLYRGDPVETELCGPSKISLREGENRVVATPAPGVRAEAVVFDSGSGSSASAVRPLALREKDPTRLELTPPVDPATTTVVVRQNVNAGWQASRLGGRLTPITVDGWQQAWRLEGGGKGPIALEFAPNGIYRWGLVVGLLYFLVLVVVCLTVRGGRSLPPAAPRRVPLPVGIGLAAVAMGLVAGVWGVLALGAGLLVTRWSPLRRWSHLTPLMLIAPTAGAVVVYAISPWGDPGGWAGTSVAPQLLVTLALALLLAVALGDPGRLPRRMKGRSTPQ